MRVIVSHTAPQSYEHEKISAEGEDYEALCDQLLSQVPEGRIAASINVER